jgi:hypothetical protein
MLSRDAAARFRVRHENGPERVTSAAQLRFVSVLKPFHERADEFSQDGASAVVRDRFVGQSADDAVHLGRGQVDLRAAWGPR